MSLQDYVDVDRVLLSSRAEIEIDPWLLIQQPTFNDVAKVTSLQFRLVEMSA